MSKDMALLELLEQIARKYFDGHLSILRFTTNWRVGFGTFQDDEINSMPVGKTFSEAARAAILQFPSRETFLTPTRNADRTA